jgi:hypothetical protein
VAGMGSDLPDKFLIDLFLVRAAVAYEFVLWVRL